MAISYGGAMENPWIFASITVFAVLIIVAVSLAGILIFRKLMTKYLIKTLSKKLEEGVITREQFADLKGYFFKNNFWRRG